MWEIRVSASILFFVCIFIFLSVFLSIYFAVMVLAEHLLQHAVFQTVKCLPLDFVVVAPSEEEFHVCVLLSKDRTCL